MIKPGHRRKIPEGQEDLIGESAVAAFLGVRGFHVGGAVRPGGWQSPVDAETVRSWVELVKS